ncbi:MAG TPA: hypothetical protein VIM70_20115 [Clostridium sp.]|uniref:hypothetical protein n=1 Tax=Clostridium sp. TaxID=1506 RepID=UPI002F95956E
MYYTKLISLNVDSKETRKTHVKAIHRTLAEKDIKANSGICPKCGGKLVLRNGVAVFLNVGLLQSNREIC